MAGFEITSPRIIHCGSEKILLAAEEIARLGKRAAIVTGKRLHNGELVNRIKNDLEKFGVQSTFTQPIAGEPTVEMVDSLTEQMKAFGTDVVLAIGGGSVMDAAKAAALLVNNCGTAEDYQLKRKEITAGPVAQVFAPTTAGTGSECTRVSVLTNTHEGIKRSISHPLMTPDVVILDPQLTMSCSRLLTTLTAMDALAHAIESAVSANSTHYTRHMGLAACEKISQELSKCQEFPDDLKSRLDCLLGSSFAGLALQAGLGASHTLSPAICIYTNRSHSEVVAALLPHTIRLNSLHSPGIYTDVEKALGCENVSEWMLNTCRRAGFSCKLSSFDLKEEDWPEIFEIMIRYASHRQSNPVEITDEYAKELYMAAF